MHTSSRSQISMLQKVQNRATRLITDITKADRQTSGRLHEITGLEPINMTLHKLAKNIWTNIRDKIHRQIRLNMSRRDNSTTYDSYFPSNAKTQIQTPIYL